MIIQELDKYYRRLLTDPQSGVPMTGWGTEKATWEIGVSADGRMTSATQLTTGDGKDRSQKRSII